MQRKTCSRRCQHWVKAHPGEPFPTGRCARCGDPVSGGRTDSKWCSRFCRNALNNKARFAQKKGARALPFTDEQLRARLSMFPGCWMCGGAKEETEHVKPLSKGGWHILANLRPACKACNLRKRDVWPWVVPGAAV